MPRARPTPRLLLAALVAVGSLVVGLFANDPTPAPAAATRAAPTIQYKVLAAHLSIDERITERGDGGAYYFAHSNFQLHERPPSPRRASAFIRLKPGNDRGLASAAGRASILVDSERHEPGGTISCQRDNQQIRPLAQILVGFDVREKVVARWWIPTEFGSSSTAGCGGWVSYGGGFEVVQRYPRALFRQESFTLRSQGKKEREGDSGTGTSGILDSEWHAILKLKRMGR
jgi:hypothetical protein